MKMLGSLNLLQNMKKTAEVLHLAGRKAFCCSPGTLLFTILVLAHYIEAI